MRTESKVAQVLRTSPKRSALVDTLAEKMDVTPFEVRGCIDQSRANGENIVNIGGSIVQSLLGSNFAEVSQFLVRGGFFNQIWVEI